MHRNGRNVVSVFVEEPLSVALGVQNDSHGGCILDDLAALELAHVVAAVLGPVSVDLINFDLDFGRLVVGNRVMVVDRGLLDCAQPGADSHKMDCVGGAAFVGVPYAALCVLSIFRSAGAVDLGADYAVLVDILVGVFHC